MINDDDAKQLENDPSIARGKARTMEMFKDYFKGMRNADIAKKYGVSKQRVALIKKRDKWEKLVNEIRDRAYAALSYEWKGLVSKVTLTLKADWDRVAAKLETDEKAVLTAEERIHGRQLLDHLVKASRLADDKPTEIADTSGVVTHRVILDAGAKRYGVIPPDNNVRLITSETEDQSVPNETDDLIDD